MRTNLLALALVTFFLAGSAVSGALSGAPGIDAVELSIQQSDERGIVVDYRLPGISVKTVQEGSEQYDLLMMEGEGVSGAVGAPEVPVVTRLFAIPDRAGVRIKSVTPEYISYREVNPYPHQAPVLGSATITRMEFDNRYYGDGEFFPNQWIELSKPAILRDYRLVPLNIHPVRVNAVTGEAQVLTNIHVELEFNDEPTSNIKTQSFDSITESFAKLYRQHIANYDYINPNGEEVRGSILIVCPDVTGAMELAQELADWKRRKGYNTIIERLPNGSSTTVVKNAIQGVYNTCDPPLEFVILLGDASGSVSLACYGSPSDTDHNYSMLDGADVLPEVIVGRLTASSITELSTVVNKTLYYEREPTLTQTSWYKSGCLIAGSSSSGWSTIEVNHWILGELLRLGYSRIDSAWYNMGVSVISVMTSSANNGVSVWHYRGYIGMNGMSSGTILGLNNPFKLCFATMLTCATGSFGSSGSAQSEAWLKAGTPTVPKGGIGGVGTAGLTSTRYNNTMDQGMWAGLLHYGHTQQGPATFNGKMELYRTYQYDYSGQQYIYKNNLMGDPSVDIWMDIPQVMTVDYPDTVGVGTGSFEVTIQDNMGNPLAGRYVCLWKGAETYVGGRTNDSGVFASDVSLPTSGELLVTVTNHNDYPYRGQVQVVDYPLNPSFYALRVFDDNTAMTNGNNDSTANPSEMVELIVSLKNYGASRAAANISATLSTTDTTVNIISAVTSYPDIPPGGIRNPDGRLIVALDNNYRQDYRIPFTMDITTSLANFTTAFDVEVSSGEARVDSVSVTGNSFNPGEIDNLVLGIRNLGEWDLTGAVGTITTRDTMVHIIDGEANFGLIPGGSTVYNSSDPFIIAADNFITHGRNEVFRLRLVSSNGQEQDLYFSLVAGTIHQWDPIGPDNYGYYCIENYDSLYQPHPEYSWVEIRTTGTQLNLPDTGGDNNKSTVIAMPFRFPYYGEVHDSITVCSNGWMAFGSYAYISDFRNQRIPTTFGPPSGMLVPYWDDLKTMYVTGGVYQEYDQQNHRFIIEFGDVQHISGGTESFEVIFYDPVYYPTPTGDGDIVFQYDVATPVLGISTDHPYWTTGIMNPAHDDGIEHSVFNHYHPGAAQLAHGRAILFTTHTPFRGPLEISLDLEPINPPIVIPRNGGWFQYRARVSNDQIYNINFGAWVHATLPNGLQFGPLLVRTGNSIPGQSSMQRTVSQYIPGVAPSGNYFLNGFIGDYSTREVWTTDSIPFSKLGNVMGGDDEWLTTGWDEEPVDLAEVDLPSDYRLYPAHPNPFNPSTSLSFTLPEAGQVELTIFDVSGREVARLVNGWLNAGLHTCVWDAEGLPSGLYFSRLKAGSAVRTEKLLLIK